MSALAVHFVTLLVAFAGVHSRECAFTTWEGQRITAVSIFGNNFGVLGDVYNISSVEDCAHRCLQFRYCYTAVYSRTGPIHRCKLYYYNFPPNFLYEVASPARIEPALPRDDESLLIFNLTATCVEKGSYTHPCSYRLKERFSPPPRTLSVSLEPDAKLPAINAEHCAILCKSRDCRYAVFVHRQPSALTIAVHSDCYFYSDGLKAEVFASARKGAVLLGDVECRSAPKPTCSYYTSDLIYTNRLPGHADIYYAALTASECAQVCGHDMQCLSAVWDPRTRRCALYNEGMAQGNAFVAKAGRKRNMEHLVSIKCEERPSSYESFSPRPKRINLHIGKTAPDVDNSDVDLFPRTDVNKDTDLLAILTGLSTPFFGEFNER